MALPTNQGMGQDTNSDFGGLVLLKRHCLLIKIEISWQQGQRRTSSQRWPQSLYHIICRVATFHVGSACLEPHASLACVCMCMVASDSWLPHCRPPGSSVRGIPRQVYWSGLSCPPPGDLSDPGIEPGSLALQVDSSPPEPLGKHPAFTCPMLNGNQLGINFSSCSGFL